MLFNASTTQWLSVQCPVVLDTDSGISRAHVTILDNMQDPVSVIYCWLNTNAWGLGPNGFFQQLGTRMMGVEQSGPAQPGQRRIEFTGQDLPAGMSDVRSFFTCWLPPDRGTNIYIVQYFVDEG